MTFIEVGSYIVDVEKIVYIHMLSHASMDIYFEKDVKIRVSGRDMDELRKYLLNQS